MLTSTLTLPHEVIVSDGGSSDRTRRTGDKKYATVVVFSAPGRQTIARRRNDGARIARGDFLTFLDADCVIPEPDRHFTRALSHFLKNPNLVALSANLHVLPQEETFGHRLVHSVDNLGLRLKNNVFNRGESFGEFEMIRREALTRLGGFRADLVTIEDADMFRRLPTIGKNNDRLRTHGIAHRTSRPSAGIAALDLHVARQFVFRERL